MATLTAGTEAAQVDRPHDPLQILAEEHQVILGVLDDMERENARLDTGAPLRVEFWQRTLEFHEQFHERMHHQKEELLFPLIEGAETGIGKHHGPTAVLRSEHERGRAWLLRIRAAVEVGDRARLQAAVHGFLDFQRQHILKENQILFPLARRIVDPRSLAGLAQAFDAIDGCTDSAAAGDAEPKAGD